MAIDGFEVYNEKDQHGYNIKIKQTTGITYYGAEPVSYTIYEAEQFLKHLTNVIKDARNKQNMNKIRR